jgi:hypothetical protein
MFPTLVRRLAAAALVLALTGCTTLQRVDASADVHDFLSSIRNNDQATFDAHVDRDAIRRQLTGRLTTAARQAGASPTIVAMARFVANPALGLAAESLIQPGVFRAVGDMFGYSSKSPLPGKLAIASVLRSQGDGTVCAPLKQGGPCVLIFTERDHVWRLSGFEGDLSILRTPRP